MKLETLSLHHLVREPMTAGERPPPLLLLLHGVGANEADLFALAPLLDPRFLVVSARAPLSLGYGSYAWFNVRFSAEGPVHVEAEAETSRLLLLGFLDELQQAYGVDPGRVYPMGFSQGAIMTVSLVLTKPKRLAGAVAMSGRALPEMVAKSAPPAELTGLPVMVVHGTADQVLPVKFGRDIRDVLSRLPVDLTYKEYPMGHEVNELSLSDINAWLSARL